MENENQFSPHTSLSAGVSGRSGVVKRGTLVFIALTSFVVGLGLSWYIFGRAGVENKVAVSDTTTSTYVKTAGDEVVSAVAASGADAIVVKNQPLGNTVIIEKVSFENTGWVAIHEERDGGLGNTLGAGWFPAGTNSGTIELLRGMVSGGTYYAVLHSDDGDKQYNYKIDKPLTDAEGNVIMMKFVAE